MSYFVEIEGVNGKMFTFNIDQVAFYTSKTMYKSEPATFVVLNTKTDMLLKISYEDFNNIFKERLDWVAMKNREEYVRSKYRG